MVHPILPGFGSFTLSSVNDSKLVPKTRQTQAQARFLAEKVGLLALGTCSPGSASFKPANQ